MSAPGAPGTVLALAASKPLRDCPSCGAKGLTKKFCTKCGTPLKDKEPISPLSPTLAAGDPPGTSPAEKSSQVVKKPPKPIKPSEKVKARSSRKRGLSKRRNGEEKKQRRERPQRMEKYIQ